MLPSFTSLPSRTFFLAFCLFFLTPLSVFAQSGPATFTISPSDGTFPQGKTFTASVVVDSTQSFNSANATLSYDTNMLSVTGVSKNGSAFSLWAVEPSFDDNKGTVSFEGGNTSALNGKKTLLSITFKPLKEGDATVSFTSGSVLAADGKGTDIVGEKKSAKFTIGPPGVTPPSPPPPPSDSTSEGGAVPDEPVVSSTSHPEENLYYSQKKAKFTWDLPPDVTTVRLVLDGKPSTTPTTNYDPAISEKEFEQLTDGEMYFHLRYKNDGGWGPTAHRKIKIDRTPPDTFPVEVKVDASSTDAVFHFSATDTLSGIDHYEIVVDGGSPIKISLSEIQKGMYTLSGQSTGDHKFVLSAFDKAGNFTPAEGTFSITFVPEAQKKALDEGEPKPTDWRLIIDIVLVALIGFLVGYLLYERSAFRHEKYLAKREADEVRDNLGNIFAALREEVGELTGALFQKPNPSAQDREVMEKINEAIDLSEELLSKEVEDVRKLLM